MKRFIYAIIVALFSCLCITACTEETITPTSEDNTNAGGGTSADKLP